MPAPTAHLFKSCSTNLIFADTLFFSTFLGLGTMLCRGWVHLGHRCLCPPATSRLRSSTAPRLGCELGGILVDDRKERLRFNNLIFYLIGHRFRSKDSTHGPLQAESCGAVGLPFGGPSPTSAQLAMITGGADQEWRVHTCLERGWRAYSIEY